MFLQVTSTRNGKLVICECCDFDENEDEENDEENCAKMDEPTEQLDKLDIEKQEKEKASPIVRAGWFGKGLFFINMLKQFTETLQNHCRLPKDPEET